MILLLPFILFAGIFAKNQPNCGKKPVPKSHPLGIVNGETAQPHSWPWVASFSYFDYRDNKWHHNCGASIINSRWALTAAHCGVTMDWYSPSLIAGIHNQTNYNESLRQKSHVANFIPHPQYSDNPLYSLNDIALLKLETPLNLEAEGIGTICIPEQSSGIDEQVGKYLTVAGWGITAENVETPSDVLMKVDLELISVKRCRFVYMLPKANLDQYLCTDAPNKSICKGDSGTVAAFHQMKEDRYYAYGVVNFGRNCHNTPGVYARVSHYSDWIWETIHRSDNENTILTESSIS